ncbi:AAA family ATPase [Atopobiaceae bacterium HCP3S3_A4]
MKILKLEIDGERLYEDERFSLDLYAADRVVQPRDGIAPLGVTRLGNTSIYLQNAIALSGVNASGKTTSLYLLKMACAYLLVPCEMRSDGHPSSASPARLEESFVLKAIFWHEDRFYALEADFEKTPAGSAAPYVIRDEWLYRLKKTRPLKKDLATFDAFVSQSELLVHRNAKTGEPGALSDDAKTFLQDDMSIVSALVGRSAEQGLISEHLEERRYAPSVVNAFDASIESLEWDPAGEIYRFKFFGEPERQLGCDAAERLLSKGTLAGMNLVNHTIAILGSGGIMLVDDIESGLSKPLAEMFLHLFLSPAINRNGAQLVFTTHYPEIIDALPRKDDVYVLVRDESHKTEAIKYSDRVHRIENKKSEVIRSNFIKGSVPSYPKVRNLMDYILASTKRTTEE